MCVTSVSFGGKLSALCLVWVVAAIYANYVQNPLTERLRARVTAWALPVDQLQSDSSESGAKAGLGAPKPELNQPEPNERTPLAPQVASAV